MKLIFLLVSRLKLLGQVLSSPIDMFKLDITAAGHSLHSDLETLVRVPEVFQRQTPAICLISSDSVDMDDLEDMEDMEAMEDREVRLPQSGLDTRQHTASRITPGRSDTCDQ